MCDTPEATKEYGLDHEFVARLNALVSEFKERGLDPDSIGALMEHVSETHGVQDG
jgi:hypothetical protein